MDVKRRLNEFLSAAKVSVKVDGCSIKLIIPLAYTNLACLSASRNSTHEMTHIANPSRFEFLDDR